MELAEDGGGEKNATGENGGMTIGLRRWSTRRGGGTMTPLPRRAGGRQHFDAGRGSQLSSGFRLFSTPRAFYLLLAFADYLLLLRCGRWRSGLAAVHGRRGMAGRQTCVKVKSFCTYLPTLEAKYSRAADDKQGWRHVKPRLCDEQKRSTGRSSRTRCLLVAPACVVVR